MSAVKFSGNIKLQHEENVFNTSVVYRNIHLKHLFLANGLDTHPTQFK